VRRGVVEEVGSDVTTIKLSQFVVGSFWASDNTCAICRAGDCSVGVVGARAVIP
jgi:Zn-dependent alcohol dehydrogenase